MELLTSASLETSFSPEPEVATPDAWIHVLEQLPEDGEPVDVILERSHEIRIAWRGHYQSTGAWFDAKTRQPIYEPIAHWKARSRQLGPALAYEITAVKRAHNNAELIES
jgi:hypothetical protein